MSMEKWEHLRIPLADIKQATSSFRNQIGRGGYGLVYEGELAFNGKVTKIAVKKLNEVHGQGLKEFLTEIDLLSGQQHENIITLLGFCDEGNEKIIVYEHAEHGSLERYIRCSDTTKLYTLTWLQRLKIVVDAARGLDHLHNHLYHNQVIIHRDIKSSNILLDHNWVAKISDLGLSKSTFSGFDRTTVISYACGTMGYVEPEYIRYGMVSKKSDVYSFGMVLFEVLCGRLCTTREEDGILLLADVVKEYCDNNKLDMLIDPCLREQMSPNALSRYSTIAYKCLLDRKDRPHMDVVKKELEETLKFELKMQGIKIPRFSLVEIKRATFEFAVKNLLREGSLGKVYHGNILGREVAINRLHTKKDLSFSRFLKEIELLSSCDHVNIISLVGYCDEGDERILVYEYMPNGSLYDYLHKHKHLTSRLTVKQHLEICLGVAKGIEWHIAPEYYEPSYNFGLKANVYCFGVILLEVLCEMPSWEELVKLAPPLIMRRELERSSPQHVKTTISPKWFRECEDLIQRCIENDPDKRPTMNEVVERLELALKLQIHHDV